MPAFATQAVNSALASVNRFKRFSFPFLTRISLAARFPILVPGRQSPASGPQSTAAAMPMSLSADLEPELFHVRQIGAPASGREDAEVQRDVRVDGSRENHPGQDQIDTHEAHALVPS